MLNRTLFTRLARSSCSAVGSRTVPLTTVRYAGQSHVRGPPREHLTRVPLQRMRLLGVLSGPRCEGRKETLHITPAHSDRAQLNGRLALALSCSLTLSPAISHTSTPRISLAVRRHVRDRSHNLMTDRAPALDLPVERVDPHDHDIRALDTL